MYSLTIKYLAGKNRRMTFYLPNAPTFPTLCGILIIHMKVHTVNSRCENGTT